MDSVQTIGVLREKLKGWRQTGDKIAFVPTMGNLHAGHLQLVKTARQQADRVVVSIFVNPIQFGEGEDFEVYPRTEQADLKQLQQQAVDLVFLPPVEVMYPQPLQTTVSVPVLSERWCGASRPGHFDGVATVVSKLFNLVQPDVAVFGEKDFQQLAVIRQMVADLNFPINIVSVPIIRERDGLAMSSRNQYLTPSQRMIAPRLYQSLCAIRESILQGQTDFEQLTEQHRQALETAGFKIDYLAVCQAATLKPAIKTDRDLVILAAAWLGKPRLIDNLTVRR